MQRTVAWCRSLPLLRCFIQVEDVNDNAPLTSEPVYPPVRHGELSQRRVCGPYPSPGSGWLPPSDSRLMYRITAGNPQNFFSIDYNTGNTFCSMKETEKLIKSFISHYITKEENVLHLFPIIPAKLDKSHLVAYMDICWKL